MKPYIPALVIIVVVVLVLVGWAVYSHNSSSPTVATTATSTVPVAAATSTSSLPVYTLADIAQHATAASCWLAIDGNVYDVTNFIPIHPGGKAILRGCGKDASALFHSVPAHAEANAEATVAPKYLIGTLSTSTSSASASS